MQAMESGGDEHKTPHPPPQRLTLEDMRQHFGTRTIHEAAKEMGVGLTVLKKRCRELGIERWPFRMLSSVAKLMDQVKKLGENEELEPEARKHQLEHLEWLQQYYFHVLEHPETSMSEEMKKDFMQMRQAFFKKTHNDKKSGVQNTGARRPVQPQESSFSFGENW